MEYCMTIVGYNVLSSSFDYVTYNITLDDTLLLYVVTISEWQFALTFV